MSEASISLLQALWQTQTVQGLHLASQPAVMGASSQPAVMMGAWRPRELSDSSLTSQAAPKPARRKTGHSHSLALSNTSSHTGSAGGLEGVPAWLYFITAWLPATVKRDTGIRPRLAPKSIPNSHGMVGQGNVRFNWGGPQRTLVRGLSFGET